MSELSDKFDQVIGGQDFRLRAQLQAQLEYLNTLDKVAAVRDEWTNRLTRSGLVAKIITTGGLVHHYQKAYCHDTLAVSPFEGRLSFDESERLLGGIYIADLSRPRPHNCAQVFLYERLGSALLPALHYEPDDVVLVADAISDIRFAADYYSFRLEANSTIPGPGSVTPSHIFGPDR